MSSYSVFFRPKDPPRGSAEAEALLRVRLNRNLNRKLKIFEEEGEWVEALRVIANAKRVKQQGIVNGWHYALAVHAFLNNESGPREQDFLTEIHESVILGDISLNVPLLVALLTAYEQFGKAHDALKLIELARENGTLQRVGKRCARHFLSLGAKLNSEGLWENALDVLALAQEGLSPEDTYQHSVLCAESHAIGGNWSPALQCMRDLERKTVQAPNDVNIDDSITRLRLSVAHAAATNAQWDVSLKFLDQCVSTSMAPQHRQQLAAISASNLNSLRASGQWQNVLRYAHVVAQQYDKKAHALQVESVHAMALSALHAAGHWRRALAYYMDQCGDCDFVSGRLRESVALVMEAAGRTQAARRVLGVSKDSRPTVPFSTTAMAYYQAAPERDLLGDDAQALDFRSEDPELVPLISRPKEAAHRLKIRPENDFALETPLSLRHTPKIPQMPAALAQARGFHSHFSQKDFKETSPPPPTRFYDRANGWSHWGLSGLPQRKHKKAKTAYNFSHTQQFEKIPEYKKSWKKHRMMRNLFRR